MEISLKDHDMYVWLSDQLEAECEALNDPSLILEAIEDECNCPIIFIILR